MENNEVVYLYLDDIIPNRFQPREVFDDQALKELAVSIKEHGVIQPIIVRKVENKYEIIAGERRYKASTMAGLTKIPAIVKNLDDKESSKVALIENLQRRDLTPIEEARTYQKILELETGMTQEQLAQTMGKTQSVVSNKLRLLALPDEVQDALLKEKISERHARSLLNVTNKNDQVRMLDKIIAEKMTVRELDKEIREMNDNQGQVTGNNPVTGNNNTGNSFNIFESINSIKNNSQTTSVLDNNKDNNVDLSSVMSNVQNNVSSNSLFDNAQESVDVLSVNNSPSVNFNPTSVDIDKIRENAVDIGGVKQTTVDVKDLMKDSTVNNDVGFRFVPADNISINENLNNSMNNNSLLSSNNGITSSNSVNFSSSGFGGINSSNEINIPNFASNDVSNDTAQNTSSSINFASSMNNNGNVFNLNSFNNSNKRDVTVAINDIKSVIKNIETKGYNVLFEENDSDNTYQITIKVNKNF